MVYSIQQPENNFKTRSLQPSGSRQMDMQACLPWLIANNNKGGAGNARMGINTIHDRLYRRTLK